ncbi:MAG: histidine kinase [Beutenbergiaceae bacterium]
MSQETDGSRAQRDRPPVADVLLAGGLILVLVPILLAISTGFLAGLFGIGQLAALAWRRTKPGWAALAVGAFAVAHFATGQFLLPSDIAVLIVLYSVTAYGREGAGRVALLAAMGGALLQGLGAAFAEVGSNPADVAAVLFVFFAGGSAALALPAWGLGLMRRARLVQRHAQAEREARIEAERESHLRLASQSERNRIAREMHDIVAHSLSVVIAQADGGRYAGQSDPAAATRALTTISETGRAALADMRRILGVLRAEDGDAAALVPQPSDTDIAALVETMRETIPVSLVEMGTPRPLPPGVGASLHRIAQEALTNVLKHAGPQVNTTVMLQWAPDHVVIKVEDDGRGAAAQDPGSAGHGVLGMRERAAMLGGTLSAGPRPGGGYRVRAQVPIQGGPAASRLLKTA